MTATVQSALLGCVTLLTCERGRLLVFLAVHAGRERQCACACVAALGYTVRTGVPAGTWWQRRVHGRMQQPLHGAECGCRRP